MKQILFACCCPLTVPEGDGEPLHVSEEDLLPAHFEFLRQAKQAAEQRDITCGAIEYWLAPLRGEPTTWLLDYGIDDALAWLIAV